MNDKRQLFVSRTANVCLLLLVAMAFVSDKNAGNNVVMLATMIGAAAVTFTGVMLMVFWRRSE